MSAFHNDGVPGVAQNRAGRRTGTKPIAVHIGEEPSGEAATVLGRIRVRRFIVEVAQNGGRL
jgi:hypothetical protein